MAFCGVTFDDEKKVDEKAFDHRVKNKLAFSAVANQEVSCCDEGCLVRNAEGVAKDRRIKILYDKQKPALLSFTTICQMAVTLNDVRGGIGSCVRVKVCDVSCILTCAHNLVSKSHLTGKFVKHKVGYTYKMRQGEEAWESLWKLVANKITLHPNYTGDACSGFDIGVCPVIREPHKFDGKVDYGKLIKDVEWGSVNPKDLKEGFEIEVGGYPGDKDGYPHYGRGKIVAIKNTEKGGCVLFYDVDTTPGNSGSPIMIVDERFFSEEKKKRGITKQTIGVHTGHSAHDNLNFGTLITPALEKWIKSAI